jgi:4a-hydroxytetrahydrobiopterin dehydratase
MSDTPDKPLAKRKCKPCEGNVPPLPPDKAQAMMSELDSEWMLLDDGRLIAKSFHFKDFVENMAFVNKVAAIAEEEGHHPDMTISYADLTIELMTHAIGGLSENDYILAAKIDEIQK